MSFLKTTLIGGIVFLIPIAICMVILGKVHRVMERLAAPLAELLPTDTIAGMAKAKVLAVVAVVVICFLAGLLSRSRLVARMIESLEARLLSSIPGYEFIKGLTGELAGVDEERNLEPVLARFDDSSQVAFRVERLADGRAVLFVPGAPDPWSGAVVIMDEERVQSLNATLQATVRSLRVLGRGSSEVLTAASGPG